MYFGESWRASGRSNPKERYKVSAAPLSQRGEGRCRGVVQQQSTTVRVEQKNTKMWFKQWGCWVVTTLTPGVWGRGGVVPDMSPRWTRFTGEPVYGTVV